MNYTLQDLAAALVSITIVSSITILAFYERVIPDGLMAGLGAAITWLFVRSAQAAVQTHNGHHD